MAVLFAGSAIASAAVNPSAPAAQDFAAFQIVTERNIFNPNRRPGVKESDAPRVAAPRPVRSEAFSLVGTMIDHQQAFAFFDGTESKYQVVLKPNSTIAGYRIGKIELNCVQLEMDTNHVALEIGMQMRRPGTGDWQLVEGTAASNGSSRSSGARNREFAGGGRDFRNGGRDARNGGREFGNRNRGPRNVQSGTNIPSAVDASMEADAFDPTAGDATVEATATTNSDADDVLKKLMEKREKELKK